MRARMTDSPNVLQYPGVSTTMSPVTQTADVEVKTAVRKSVPPGPSVATGSISSAPPTRMATANPTTTS
jgi:hypothetical protein